MPDPITLADVRAHIERRIQECVRRRDETRVEYYATSCLAEGARCAYDEILALLDRVQLLRSCPACGGSGYVAAPHCDPWPCAMCNKPQGSAL